MYQLILHSILPKDVAINLFRQSGLDQTTLVSIFDMADDDKDGVLTSKEFCVAFHLIICLRYILTIHSL